MPPSIPAPDPPLRIHQVLASHLIGGAGLVGLNLAAHVRDLGHQSHVWVPGPGPATAQLDREAISWYRYRLDALKSGGVSQALAAGAAGAHVRLSRPHLVHVHNPTIYGLLSPALRFAGAPMIVHFQIDPTADEVRWALRHRPAAVITCSRHIRSLVEASRPPAASDVPVVAVQNAVDLRRFHPGDRAAARQLVGAAPDRPLLVMLANLAPHKGQLTVLRALRHLRDRGVDVDAWFAGEDRGGAGTFAATLHQATSELGLTDCVRWLGFRDDGPDLLRAADIFLLPSTHEGLPLSVLEAQASGTLVIGAPIPGIAEVIEDDVTGLLIPPDAPEAYAEAIAALLASPDRSERIRRAALDIVRSHYSWDHYLEQIRSVYGTALGRANWDRAAGRDPDQPTSAPA